MTAGQRRAPRPRRGPDRRLRLRPARQAGRAEGALAVAAVLHLEPAAGGTGTAPAAPRRPLPPCEFARGPCGCQAATAAPGRRPRARAATPPATSSGSCPSTTAGHPLHGAVLAAPGAPRSSPPPPSSAPGFRRAGAADVAAGVGVGLVGDRAGVDHAQVRVLKGWRATACAPPSSARRCRMRSVSYWFALQPKVL